MTLIAEVDGYVRARLTAEPGATVAVVGPNGAGKTTLIRALAGLPCPAAARVWLDGRDVSDLPPHRRSVGYVPQDGALFPHLSARANVAYGLRSLGMDRRDAARAAQVWLDRLEIGELGGSRTAHLSGGQAGRVALARALAPAPRLLLLDEPLAALDSTARTEVRHVLREHLASYDGVCLLVTHDPLEAFALARRMLVVESGRVVQDADPKEVTLNPRSPWVARMLGHNAYAGLTTESGVAIRTGGGLIAAEPAEPGRPALATVAPEAVALYRMRPAGSPRNTWVGTVTEVLQTGSRLRVHLLGTNGPDIVAEVTPAAAAELGLADGLQVWVSVKATEVRVILL